MKTFEDYQKKYTGVEPVSRLPAEAYEAMLNDLAEKIEQLEMENRVHKRQLDFIMENTEVKDTGILHETLKELYNKHDNGTSQWYNYGVKKRFAQYWEEKIRKEERQKCIEILEKYNS
jgi:hypothetical protein